MHEIWAPGSKSDRYNGKSIFRTSAGPIFYFSRILQCFSPASDKTGSPNDFPIKSYSSQEMAPYAGFGVVRPTHRQMCSFWVGGPPHVSPNRLLVGGWLLPPPRASPYLPHWPLGGGPPTRQYISGRRIREAIPCPVVHKVRALWLPILRSFLLPRRAGQHKYGAAPTSPRPTTHSNMSFITDDIAAELGRLKVRSLPACA